MAIFSFFNEIDIDRKTEFSHTDSQQREKKLPPWKIRHGKTDPIFILLNEYIYAGF